MNYNKVNKNIGLSVCEKCLNNIPIYLFTYYPDSNNYSIYDINIDLIRISESEGFRIRGTYVNKCGNIKKVTCKLENLEIINSLSIKNKSNNQKIRLLECIILDKLEHLNILQYMKSHINDYDYKLVSNNHVNPGRIEERKHHEKLICK